MPKPRNHRRDAVEALLREACVTLGLAESAAFLPRRGQDLQDRRLPAPRALERLGRTMILVATAELTAAQRDLLWRRAQGVGWKQLEHEMGIDTTKLWRLHDAALVALGARMVRR